MDQRLEKEYESRIKKQDWKPQNEGMMPCWSFLWRREESEILYIWWGISR